MGNTSPNPPVGAVIARDGRILGEGHHEIAGGPHAEVHALADAARRGEDVRGATIYVSLEPCAHHGRTPPCADAVIAAGIARVVIGAEDPNPRTDRRGIAALRAAGIAVDVVHDAAAMALIDAFSVAIRHVRPYVVLKMAASLDGYIASEPGVQTWLTGDESRAFVHGLRAVYDAVMVGAGTVRVDDPELTARPFVARNVPYTRVVVCESDAIPLASRVLHAPADHREAYAQTIVLAPAAARERFRECETIANVVFAGPEHLPAGAKPQLDLAEALDALGRTGIRSVLCEGGPTLAGRLLAAGLVDRIHWLYAPRLMRSDTAIPMLASGAVDAALTDVVVQRLGADVHVTARIAR